MAQIRERKDVWKLNQWDDILVWYAKAIAAMQNRPVNDPTSWRYQAAIHDYVSGQDPRAVSGDVLPSNANQQRFWRQCQHNSWFFLPWHRMYLFFFEQIVAATVVQLGGPDGWALPYWNYSDATNPDARRLPPAFRANQLPDGSANPLLVADRDQGNDGSFVADEQDVDLSDCLGEPSFVADPVGGNPGFGGPKTLFHHSGGVVGKLETSPHGSIHVDVGGWMGQFNTAGLDPLFWLHHANIDRLWSVWRARAPQDLNPTNAQWLNGVAFQFNDALGNIVSLTSQQVVDTTTAPLSYKYEDESDPIGGVFPAPIRRPEMEEPVIPEMVGATAEPVMLTGQPSIAQFTVTTPAGPAGAPRPQGAPPPKIYLNIENITGSGKPTSHAVYLNVPPGSDPASHPELFAGVLPMFGVAESSRSDENHSGSGLHYALEVGDIIRALEAKGEWNPTDVRVTFVPKRPVAGVAGPLPAPAQDAIKVGRVSLYYA